TLHQLFISTVSFSPDSTELAAVLHHRPKDNVVFDKIIFLDVKSGQTLREPELHGYWDVTFSPNWKFFAASNSDGYIHLWDLKDKTILHKLIGHHRLVDEHSFLNDIASSPDETLLVSVEGNRVRFWDTQTGKLVGEIVPPFSVFCITFSPDGRLIATTGNDGTVRIWGVQP
ncbi:MAG TPA: hypothetical protein VI547_02325, partial [Anaerolineales bacterium]|nr:hypothetical protein [Anaerolineales bacterium]